ncbi:TIGR02206 family membrane protein [Mesobacillus subterraneus]|uniref:YwaF family protein n=1 Tax=Mesobacillus subterraneus TaxID=285983 RepID=UPI001CFC8295|nr:TIGR02206 family membrane protein [Mesobacillus subterraneus]
MEWFGHSNKGFNFDMFSLSHYVTLTIFFLVCSLIFIHRKKLSVERWRKAELGTALSLILIEITNHLWMYKHAVWKLGRSMPLELCNIGLLLAIGLLLTRKKILFELLFFIALLGATQAIITPALTYDFPHFRFFHFFYAHMMIVWVTLYFLCAKGYYPTFRSVIKVVLFINMLLPVILFINTTADGNYWFLRHKPKSPSFLDLLGPYPWYIFSLESLLVILSLITWLCMRSWLKGEKRSSYSES